MKKGFTLAEVLITLTVIGVIAVLTMPSLIANYQTKIMITQLQKVYNQISNAVLDAMRDEVVVSYRNLPWFTSNESKILNFYETYFDVTNTCIGKQYKGCLADTYTSYDGTQTMPAKQLIGVAHMNGAPCAVIKSGATICTLYFDFLIDVNGPTNPNALGKDVFWFMVRNDGKIITSTNDPARYMKDDPYYSRHESTFDEARVQYRKEANGDGCFGSSISARFNGCLPYIMSHGWKMK